jgi:hypothetical protein
MTGRQLGAMQGKVEGWTQEKNNWQKITLWMVIGLFSWSAVDGSLRAQSSVNVDEWLILGAFPARDNNALATDLVGGEARGGLMAV